MSPGKIRSAVLWSISFALLGIGIIADDPNERIAAVVVGLFAVVASVDAIMHQYCLLLIHVIALFKDDTPIDTPLGRHAARLMREPIAPDG